MKRDIFRKSGISALAVVAALAFAPVSAGAQQIKADGTMKLAQAEPERGGPGGPGGPGGGGRGGGERGPGGGGQGRGGPPPGAQQAPQQAPMAQSPRGQGGPGGRIEQRQQMQAQPQQQQPQRQMRMEQRQMQMQSQQPQMRMEGRRMQQPGMRSEERRTVTRQRDFDRRGAYRYDDRRRDYGRYRDRNVSGFVFLGGPRVVVRNYGPGWCRGLHRGYHRAPGIGWHRGTHRGLFRC